MDSDSGTESDSEILDVLNQSIDKITVINWIYKLNICQTKQEYLAYSICAILLKQCSGKYWFQKYFILVFDKLYHANSNSKYFPMLNELRRIVVEQVEKCKSDAFTLYDITCENIDLAKKNLETIEDVVEQADKFISNNPITCTKPEKGVGGIGNGNIRNMYLTDDDTVFTDEITKQDQSEREYNALKAARKGLFKV